MPFVISAGTLVTGFGAGIQSVSVNLSPQIQRLYQLGSIVPFDKNVISQTTLNISKYSGSGGTYSVLASSTCDDASSIILSITAGGCSGAISVSDTFFLTSYSYSKDAQGWGIESFSFVSKPEVIGSGATVNMIRGVAEGQSTTDGGANTGVVFITGGTTIPGTTVDVTAGSPGIGKAFTIEFGEVETVGGGTGKADGLEGNANVSAPYTPVYLP